MLNLVDDEPQPLANGHASGPVENGAAAAGAQDPVAELMGLHIGGQPSAASPAPAQNNAGITATHSMHDNAAPSGNHPWRPKDRAKSWRETHTTACAMSSRMGMQGSYSLSSDI